MKIFSGAQINYDPRLYGSRKRIGLYANRKKLQELMSLLFPETASMETSVAMALKEQKRIRKEIRQIARKTMPMQGRKKNLIRRAVK